MKKQRLAVAGILLFGIGGVTLSISKNLFIIVVLSLAYLYLLLTTEYEQYLKEQHILSEKKKQEELEAQQKLESYRKRKYTKTWLENIW